MRVFIVPPVLERCPGVGEWFTVPNVEGVFVRVADAVGTRATLIPQSPAGRIYATCLSSGQVCVFDLKERFGIVQPVGGTLNLEYVRPN